VQSKSDPFFHTSIFFALCLVLAACTLSGRAPTVTPSPSSTPRPSFTPTPESPLAVLVIPADMAKADSNLYQSAVYTLAQANGMRFQVLNTLTAADLQILGPSLKVAIVFPPDPGLAALVAAAPQAQFLAVGIPDLPAASNLSTLGATGQPVDKEAFLAGYTAAMLSQDSRIGIITLKDDPKGMAAEAAFANGMHFYCGLCLVSFQPYYTYPVHVEIPQDKPKSQYPAYGDPMNYYLASVVYVYPGVATVDLLESLIQRNLYLIGESMPAKDLKSNWIASFKPDLLPAIQKIFPDLVAGKGGQIVASPLALADVNPGLLSEGKQRLVQQVLDGLQAGTIATGVTP
jgi:hypothetical protein